MANHSYAYCQYTPRPQRTICPDCGTKMGPASGDPADHKNVCHDWRCAREQDRKAGYVGHSAYGAAQERGHCL